MKRLIKKTHNSLRQVRHARVRARVSGTAALPRLSVFRSLRGLTAQLIDDTAGRTLCFVKKVGAGAKVEGKSAKVAAAWLAGQELAKLAQAKGIVKVVFDRGGYKFHGRVAALAEGARAGGLQF